MYARTHVYMHAHTHMYAWRTHIRMYAHMHARTYIARAYAHTHYAHMHACVHVYCARARTVACTRVYIPRAYASNLHMDTHIPYACTRVYTYTHIYCNVRSTFTYLCACSFPTIYIYIWSLSASSRGHRPTSGATGCRQQGNRLRRLRQPEAADLEEAATGRRSGKNIDRRCKATAGRTTFVLSLRARPARRMHEFEEISLARPARGNPRRRSFPESFGCCGTSAITHG